MELVTFSDSDLVEAEQKRLCALVRVYSNILHLGEHAASVHIKSYKTVGTKKQYSVRVRYRYPSGVLITSHVHAHDAREALHKAFQRVETRSRPHSDGKHGFAA